MTLPRGLEWGFLRAVLYLIGIGSLVSLFLPANFVVDTPVGSIQAGISPAVRWIVAVLCLGFLATSARRPD